MAGCSGGGVEWKEDVEVGYRKGRKVLYDAELTDSREGPGSWSKSGQEVPWLLSVVTPAGHSGPAGHS